MRNVCGKQTGARFKLSQVIHDNKEGLYASSQIFYVKTVDAHQLALCTDTPFRRPNSTAIGPDLGPTTLYDSAALESTPSGCSEGVHHSAQPIRRSINSSPEVSRLNLPNPDTRINSGISFCNSTATDIPDVLTHSLFPHATYPLSLFQFPINTLSSYNVNQSTAPHCNQAHFPSSPLFSALVLIVLVYRPSSIAIAYRPRLSSIVLAYRPSSSPIVHRPRLSSIVLAYRPTPSSIVFVHRPRRSSSSIDFALAHSHQSHRPVVLVPLAVVHILVPNRS
ncbi:hypothetical protein DFH06DRAFT_1345197 [Mycena polygramma]|nr:hypothetical protein DFH06DRAFT_1345197 [Mycena polygramma]